jgi:hypothetical protein
MADASSPKRKARFAGLLYLVVIITGGFAEMIVRRMLIVRGDAAATAAHILAGESFFRLGLGADVLCAAAYVGVTALLYELFKPVSRTLSLTAAFFSLMGIAVMAANLVALGVPLALLSRAPAGFTPQQLQALAYTALRLHALGYTIAMVFFGSYCLALGGLIWRATFLPRLIGVLMALAGAAYLVNSFAVILSPTFAAQLPPIIFLALVGEGALCLWLLFAGVNVEKWRTQALQAKA